MIKRKKPADKLAAKYHKGPKASARARKASDKSAPGKSANTKPNESVSANAKTQQSDSSRRGLYDELVEQARSRAHKPGWVYHEYHKQSGEAPPRGWTKETKAAFAADEAWTAAVQQKEQRKSKQKRDRPIIQIEPDMTPVYDGALAALRTVEDVYERGVLVHVSEVTEAEAEELKKAGTPVHVGTPTIRETSLASLTLRMSRAARWERMNKRGEWVATRPDKAVVAALKDEGSWPGVPHLTCIQEAPFLRRNGTVCQTRGYDSESGCLYIPNADYPLISDEPTRAQAEAALDRLTDVFREFPYVVPAHIAVPVANILTILGRAGIDGPVPGYLYDASSRGSGKTLQSHVVSTVCTGRSATMKDYPITRSYRDMPPDTDEEEMRKTIDGYALQGVPIICLDNVDKVAFGGSVLEMAITTRDDRDARVLGRTEVRRVPWIQVIMANGNNICVQAHTQRRVLRCRIETAEAHPEDRTGFKYKLPGDALKLRPSLVADALTVLLAWQVAMRKGAKSELPPWDPFDDWVRVVAAAIVHAGGPNVLECRVREEVQVDLTTEATAKLLTELPARFGRRDVTAAQVLGAARDDAVLAQVLMDLVGKDDLPTPGALGARLKSAQLTGASGENRRTGKAMVVDGGDTRRLVGCYDRGAWRWSVERRGADGWERA